MLDWMLQQCFCNVMLMVPDTVISRMLISPPVNSFQLTGPADNLCSTLLHWAVMLHIYLRNLLHLDTAKGYWVSVSVIGPLRLQRGTLCHIHSFQFPVSQPIIQFNPPPSLFSNSLSLFHCLFHSPRLSLKSTTQSSEEKGKGTLQVVIWDTLFECDVQRCLWLIVEDNAVLLLCDFYYWSWLFLQFCYANCIVLSLLIGCCEWACHLCNKARHQWSSLLALSLNWEKRLGLATFSFSSEW